LGVRARHAAPTAIGCRSSRLGGAAAWPIAARAQQGDRVRRIGVLIGGGDENDPVFRTHLFAFTQALADLGWTDGRNVRMDPRWGGGDINRIRALARELVGLQPDTIVTTSIATTAALQRETRTIPIVFAGVADPVASSIVARLDRPSGNITGFANYEASLGGKWLELLSEIASGLKRAAIMFNPDTAPITAFMPFSGRLWTAGLILRNPHGYCSLDGLDDLDGFSSLIREEGIEKRATPGTSSEYWPHATLAGRR
jgi:hypothetical protein